MIRHFSAGVHGLILPAGPHAEKLRIRRGAGRKKTKKEPAPRRKPALKTTREKLLVVDLHQVGATTHFTGAYSPAVMTTSLPMGNLLLVAMKFCTRRRWEMLLSLTGMQ